MDWLNAFGTGGLPGEPSLMEELDINLPHVWDKSLAVLNPFHKFSPDHPKDAHMMDDTDLAGPLLFCFVFGMLLLLVRGHTNTGGKVAVRIRVWRRTHGRAVNLFPAEPHVRRRDRRVARHQCARLLPAAAVSAEWP